MSTLPQRWSPQAVIIDGMFLINCKPHSGTLPLLRSMQLLFNRFISPQYQAGAIEVHLVFDTPSKHPFSPKCYERKRRDQSHPSTNHNHLSFTPSTKVPQSWSSYIEYRQCKHALIETIGLAYLRSARFRLQQQKHFNIAGCMSDQTGDVAWHGLCQDLKYLSKAEEADMRIWRMQHRLVHMNASLCTLLIQMYTT